MGPLNALRRRPVTSFVYGVVWGVAGAIFVNDNLFEITRVVGESMAPTLSPEYHATGARDSVLWRKSTPYANLRRGDVVLYMQPHDPERSALKRVIGLEGDTVVLDPRRRPNVLRNGKIGREALAWDAWGGKVLVPPGHVWMEGDNAGRSKDSHYYGPISKSMIEGRAVAVVTFRTGRFWTRPWEDYKSKTKIIKSEGKLEDWTLGLPVGLEEVGAGSRWPT